MLSLCEASGPRMQRGGNKGKEVASKGATDELERHSCSLDAAVAVALFHFLLLALSSSITSHNATIAVLIYQLRACIWDTSVRIPHP